MGRLTAQAALLYSIRAFDKHAHLRQRTPICVTNVMGARSIELLDKTQEEDEEDLQRRQQAVQKLRAIRNKPDKSPCKVLPGLFIGGIGAASSLKHLVRQGITAVLCVSAVVPTFHPAALQYKVIPVYDDPQENILSYFEESNAFISQALQQGGVLIHCFAGQSRSVAFLLAYLIGCQRQGLPQAWATVKAARPSAHPNRGFVRQLAAYAQQQEVDSTIPCDMQSMR